ncbi:hypothetical protein ACFWJ5_40285 [Streptomyces qaidamensis]|uniref:hypothetical protein n=1 Tax=Streptomyces qaidamensis TaxID=1783515 RepID=UPI00365D0DAA
MQPLPISCPGHLIPDATDAFDVAKMLPMTPPTVSARTEQAPREAMERLFTGRPTRTKDNLWREAGVSRATLNRATVVLAEWDNRVGRSPASLRDQYQREEITRLRRQLRGNQQERQRLQQQVDAAATVIATLLAENAVLRGQLAKRSGVVVPLPLACRERTRVSLASPRVGPRLGCLAS